MNLQYQCSETLMFAKQGQLACSCRFFCRTLKRVPPLSKELSLDKINKTGFFIKIGQSVWILVFPHLWYPLGLHKCANFCSLLFCIAFTCCFQYYCYLYTFNACWDRGFESHLGHGCLSVVSVVSCQVEVSVMSWSLVQRSPTDCSASSCVI